MSKKSDKFEVINIDKEVLQRFDNLNEAIAYCNKMADQNTLTHIILDGEAIIW